VYYATGGAGSEQIQETDFHVINAAETLRILDRPTGCTDADGDGYGAREPQGGAGLACRRPEVDCDDDDPSVYVGATELCDQKDNNCNGHTDEERVCEGVLSDAPVSGVIPGAFSTDGGEFQVSVSPLDPYGELITEGLGPESFELQGIEVEQLAQPGVVVATGEAHPTTIEVIRPASPGRDPLNIVLLFDSSGSMAETDPARLRVQAARELLWSLGPDDRAAIMDFGADSSGPGVTRLLAPMTGDRDTLEQGLSQVTASGGTPLYEAVQEAIAYITTLSVARPVLVVLSDGQTSDDDPDTRRALAIQAAVAVALPVYAVGLGSNLDFSGLEDLTASTAATFALALDAQVLAGLFEAIGIAASRGRVIVHGEGTFMPRLQEPGRHLIRGVLRTRLGTERADTPFSFTVLIER